MGQQLQAFLQEFRYDVVQDPFLMITALLGLVTLTVAVGGTLMDPRGQHGRLSRNGFMCIGFLVVGSAGEVLLTYANERKEERDRQALVSEIEDSMRTMLEEYADVTTEAQEAEASLRRAQAGGASDTELMRHGQRLEKAWEQLQAFEERWAGDADGARSRENGRRPRIKAPRTVERNVRKQSDEIKALKLLLKHKGGLPRELEGKSLEEIERLLEAEGIVPNGDRRDRRRD